MTLKTYAVIAYRPTVQQEGDKKSLFGLIAAVSADAAIAHAAKLCGYSSTEEMRQDYATAFYPSTIYATTSDEPATYTAD